ncbi:response regulator transcription factor [Uliginosibacterium sp. H3]|uniref:Response regulator transcription factor n=1 Tax=Uliginosibacterium silvisoli TaxID=3114758 RepID=A0ABU6JZ45_9RHOO|nr:response regulator transcription factor [Uliginosibacterium sp. H3]
MSDRKLIRTLVLYQDPLVAAGLQSALARQPDVVMVEQEMASTVEADVIVTDYPGGLSLLASMHTASLSVRLPYPRILILTDRDTECEIRHALEQGARGYLTLGCGVEELADAVRALHRGARHIGAAAASRLADSVASESLTGRELDVLRLLVEGLPNKAIATQLNIAPGTVKSHMKGIFQKLGASSRTQVATLAERRGLLSLAASSQAQVRTGAMSLAARPQAHRHTELL